MELLQDGAVTVIAVAAAAIAFRRQFASWRKDASPKCSNCASGCDDTAEVKAAPPNDAAHPMILVRRPPR
jgi:anaerobic selenocysteine-containing dehydrogenase